MSGTRNLDEIFSEICATEAPLAERLAAFTDALDELGTPFAAAYENLVGQLAGGGVGTAAPGVGDPLPPFVLPDPEGRLVSLEALLGEGPLVVSFNRGHWCQFCELELAAFAAAHAEIAGHGARVVSIMPERAEYLDQVRERTGSKIVVLSDIDNGYALSLGLVIWIGETVRKLYVEHGVDLEHYHGNSMWFVPVPATFVVARDGRIAARHVDPDFRKRMEIDEVLAALAALKS